MVARKIIIVLGLIILILIIGFGILKQGKEQGGGIFPEERQLIETWILENDLNQYGDPKDTVYIGGTPLFDERTGERIDKYEYIFKNYPDKPWLK